jgi:hypothetical protein
MSQELKDKIKTNFERAYTEKLLKNGDYLGVYQQLGFIDKPW